MTPSTRPGPADGIPFYSRVDVARLLSMDACIAAVEAAFRAHGAGTAAQPSVLSHHVPGGGFHVKAASLRLSRHYFAAKTNGNFFDNAARGLPRIQGALVLCDADNGTPLATMDSAEITVLRTAAATAVAARHLAESDAGVLAIVGCGLQGRAHVHALSRVRTLRAIRLYDVDRDAADRLARELRATMVVDVARDVQSAVNRADMIVACTPSREPILDAGDIRAGAFVAGVGADSEEKHELGVALLASAYVVADVRAQCAAFGDLAHAIRAGAMAASDVFAELGEIVAGVRPPPPRDGRPVVFDSTGTALQDVAAAAIVFERATSQRAPG